MRDSSRSVDSGIYYARLTVDGETEGTFTSDKKETGTIPQLPGRDTVSTAEFRLILSILDPKTNLIWSSGQTMALMVTVQNLSTSDIEIAFRAEPWNNIIVRNVGTSAIVWRLHPVTLPVAPKVTFPWADGFSWATTWDLRDQGGSLLPPGEYDIVATFATEDPRMPQEARIRIRIL